MSATDAAATDSPRAGSDTGSGAADADGPTSYTSATYSAAFVPGDASTAAYLRMLDEMRALATHGPRAQGAVEQLHAAALRGPRDSACPHLAQYGVALVPLCHAIGDLSLCGDDVRTVRQSAMLLFAGYDDCAEGDDASPSAAAAASGAVPLGSVDPVVAQDADSVDVEAAEIAARTRRVTMGGAWAMTAFASDRVVDEALLALSAALQRCVVAALCHWYALDARTGHAFPVGAPDMAGAATATGALEAHASYAYAPNGDAGAGTGAVPSRPREAAMAADAARNRRRIEDLARLEREGFGIVATLSHILRCDTLTDAGVAAATAATAAALGVNALDRVTSARATAPLPASASKDTPAGADTDTAAAPPSLVHADADAAQRPSRQSLKATVLALMLYCTQLLPAARALCELHRTCGVIWLGRAAHVCALKATPEEEAATVVALRATRRHWLEAAHGCIQLHAQAARPDAPVPLRAIYTSIATWADSCRRVHFRAASVFFAAHCDWSAVVWTRACALADNPDPGASEGAAYVPTLLESAAAAGTAEPADAAIAVALCPGSAGGGGPGVPLPWFPDGIALEQHTGDALMVYAFMRRYRMQQEGGRTAAVLYPHPTTIYNWHMPDCYYALVREPRVETRPITALMSRVTASDAIRVAIASVPPLVFASPAAAVATVPPRTARS